MSGFAPTKESSCDCSDCEDCNVCNPWRDGNTRPLRTQCLRTHIDYDNFVCHAGYNLRCVKWGPQGGVWEHRWTPVTAHGPPNETLRWSERYCWLCNAWLKEHRRTWTRRSGENRSPYERLKNKGQLRMTIYCCPNGCDADDALQALLDKTDHTGPSTRPIPSQPCAILMSAS